ncbi:hypothetical protein BST81_10585 [Leptolyngbya sp. 'hensonii']|uniref:hypothetical protein n=1 Tax=Leptolyngbya sp. 'hensonii' TaxID=1922337 RepID=UPI00094FEFF7|nr:hypothetical protein [Leptolyngbya sp. 'hensonii']OLP18516.1 hypothetical protein BST81_10585 [Leptolyngbya sp. 'hensonii']
MSAKFLESFGGKLAEQWVATLLTPALVFWAGGAAAGLQRFGWTTISTWFNHQPEPLQVALLVAAFCLIAASAFVVQRFDLPVLRFLEGYWHPWFRPLRRWFIAKEARRSQRISDRWQTLTNLNPNQLTAESRDELVQLDWQQLHIPLPNHLMPTRLGNILRAAEQRPLEKYGLDAIVCWSRLWLLLPDAVKKDLQDARADLNTAARVWLWSLLFIVWTALGAWWAAPIGILSVIFTYYYWALDAARTYGELIEATFDLHRHLLYQSLRWNLPADPAVERRVGQELTRYLWRGY